MTELRDSQLLAYLDGKATPEEISQIERSKDLLDRARELGKIHGKLVAKLYRTDCPDPLALGEYHQGVLSTPLADRISRHLKVCPHCQKEIQQAADFMNAGLVEQVRVFVAELISGGKSGLPGLTPAFGTRGMQAGPLIYQADGVKIALDIEDDGDHPGRKVLIGLITGLQAQDYEVLIWRGGQSFSSAKVNEVGNFDIPDLEDGVYEILIKGPKVEIHVQTFNV